MPVRMRGMRKGKVRVKVKGANPKHWARTQYIAALGCGYSRLNWLVHLQSRRGIIVTVWRAWAMVAGGR